MVGRLTSNAHVPLMCGRHSPVEMPRVSGGEGMHGDSDLRLLALVVLAAVVAAALFGALAFV